MSESWARKHATENPGHRTREGLDDPGSCDDCRERSPAYNLADARVFPPEPRCLIHQSNLCGPGCTSTTVFPPANDTTGEGQ